MFNCCGSNHGALSLVRPVLSLVSATSFCLVFCLEDAQRPKRGLIECMCGVSVSSHVCWRNCCMCCCRMALQSPIGYFKLIGSGKFKACFAKLSALSLPAMEACPGIQRNEMFCLLGIDSWICEMM